MLNTFETRYKSFLSHTNEVVRTRAYPYAKAKEWNIEDTECTVATLTQLSHLRVFALLLEWKAMEQNTFFPKYKLNGCIDFVYPSDLPEAELLSYCELKKDCCTPCHNAVEKGKGFIGLFNCYHINIVPAIEAMGIYPKGARPDGISYMVISDNSTSICSPPNPFQVNKQ